MCNYNKPCMPTFQQSDIKKINKVSQNYIKKNVIYEREKNHKKIFFVIKIKTNKQKKFDISTRIDGVWLKTE